MRGLCEVDEIALGDNANELALVHDISGIKAQHGKKEMYLAVRSLNGELEGTNVKARRSSRKPNSFAHGVLGEFLHDAL